jgi:hypothetical protein
LAVADQLANNRGQQRLQVAGSAWAKAGTSTICLITCKPATKARKTAARSAAKLPLTNR